MCFRKAQQRAPQFCVWAQHGVRLGCSEGADTHKNNDLRTFLVVQVLRLHTPNAGVLGSIPVRGNYIPEHSTNKAAMKIEDLACSN